MNNNSISILGCGWLGLPLAKHLISHNYGVKGSSRSLHKNALLKEKGITPYCIDLSNKATNFSEFLRSETLICVLPSKDIEGFQHLITHIEKSMVKQVLFISATSVYNAHPNPITENNATNNCDLAIIEQLFLNKNTFKTTILRFGGLIGPKRNPGNFFKKGRLVKAPDSPVNMIHLDDCIHIIHQIILQKSWNTILNACTDSHPSKREFYRHMTHISHKETPNFDSETESLVKLISNEKLKKLLNYSFIHTDLMQLTLEDF
ncbi:MAG: NAD(P)-dependent oxidoreductase [Flavobacteriaceae bacterium]|nr:MAG: NAD(P)-dependent oxidoreductase [Flavobacteriaceae bacterium]